MALRILLGQLTINCPRYAHCAMLSHWALAILGKDATNNE